MVDSFLLESYFFLFHTKSNNKNRKRKRNVTEIKVKMNETLRNSIGYAWERKIKCVKGNQVLGLSLLLTQLPVATKSQNRNGKIFIAKFSVSMAFKVEYFRFSYLFYSICIIYVHLHIMAHKLFIHCILTYFQSHFYLKKKKKPVWCGHHKTLVYIMEL